MQYDPERDVFVPTARLLAPSRQPTLYGADTCRGWRRVGYPGGDTFPAFRRVVAPGRWALLMCDEKGRTKDPAVCSRSTSMQSMRSRMWTISSATPTISHVRARG